MTEATDVIFVTGGTGLLGNSIVRELCDRGIRTRVLCRAGTPRTPFDGLDVEIIEGELNQPDVLQSAIAGCRAVIHSAALIHIGWGKLAESRRVNVEGTRHLVAACQAHQARLIHVSTVDTLPAALDKQHAINERSESGIAKIACTYVVSKTESEQVVRDAVASKQLEAVIIHPGFMLGPYDWKPSSGRMLLEVHKAHFAAAPPGGCSVCDARDVARAIVNAIDRGRAGENYILAGENLTYQELWRQMLTVSGRKRRVYRMGKGLQWLGSGIDALNRWGVLREGDINGAAIAMGSLNHFYDSSKAERELSYVRRPIEQTLVDAWAWLTRTESTVSPARAARR